MEESKNISLLVTSLQSKVEKLIIQNKKAKEDVKQLREENSFLRNNLTQYKERVKELEEKNKILKLAKTLDVGSEKSTDLKLKINELVREIDKCIALVNN